MDELEISGRRYLSTRRAAKDHKYTSDYVGQLIRAGKVVGKKVGRSWYVEEQSLNAYLNGGQTEAPPALQKPVERLAEEPAPSVVAEIKEEVTKKVLTLQPTAEVVSEQRVEEKNDGEETFEPVILKTKNLEEHHIPIRTVTTPANKTSTAGLRYVADDEPALPEIKRKGLATMVSAVPPQKSFSEENIDEEYVEIIPNKRVGVFAIAGLVVVGLATLSATALLSATLNARIVVEQGQVASVGYTFQ